MHAERACCARIVKRTEAEVGSAVYVGGASARVETWARAVVVALDCGDNGYRIGLACEQRNGEWKYGMWPLHSVHTEATYAEACARSEAERARLIEQAEQRRARLDSLRADARAVEAMLDIELVVVPDQRGGEHYVRCSSTAFAAIAGALRRSRAG
jgi:hypothetical protein